MTPHHLNPLIDYSVATGPQSEIDQSLAFPMGLAFSSDSHTLFATAFGSGKLAAIDANALEAGTISTRRNVESLILAFDTGLKPAVGQQVSVTASSVADSNVIARIDLLAARDDAGDCDLVAKGVVGGLARGWVYAGGNTFRSDRISAPLIDKTALRQLATTAGQELVFTCVPPGSGTRIGIGIDRDGDGSFDRDELDAGSDPADPLSLPPGAPTPTFTVTPTATGVPTGTATATRTPTPTITTTATSTRTATGTPTITRTPSRTPTRTATGTATPTVTVTFTATPLVDCAGSATIERANLRIMHNDGAPGERITIGGQFTITNLSPAVDPAQYGLGFRLIDRATGMTLVNRQIPAGSGEPGWSGSDPKWRFREPNRTASAGGVTKVLLKDRSARTPGLFLFRITGSDANFQVGTADLELVVVLGATAQASNGQCARVLFNSGAPAPRCTLSSGGAILRCR